MYIWKRKKKVIINACTNNTIASVHRQLHHLASKEFSSIWWLWFIKILWSEYSVILAHFNWLTFILIRYFHHFVSMHVQWILSQNELHLTLNILHIILYISFKKVHFDQNLYVKHHCSDFVFHTQKFIKYKLALYSPPLNMRWKEKQRRVSAWLWQDKYHSAIHYKLAKGTNII